MTRRVVLFALPLLGFVGGCKTLSRNVEAVGYRPDAVPSTILSPCDATYDLVAPEPDTYLAYATIDLPKGAVVGFRREFDGSLVAIAGQQTTPIPDERATWRYTPSPNAAWERLVVDARGKCEEAAIALILPPFVVWQVLTGGELP